MKILPQILDVCSKSFLVTHPALKYRAFFHTYDTPLEVSTIIRFDVKESDTVLYKTKRVTIVYPGEIIIENVPSLITFEFTPITLSPLLCPRKENIQILVTDSRVNSEDWNLYLTVTSEFKDEDDVLNGSLVFLDNDTLTTLTTEQTLIYKENKNEGDIKETTITWSSDKGLLLRINKPLKNVATYKATLLWTLE